MSSRRKVSREKLVLSNDYIDADFKKVGVVLDLFVSIIRHLSSGIDDLPDTRIQAQYLRQII